MSAIPLQDLASPTAARFSSMKPVDSANPPDSEPASELSLVRAARSGDVDAFEALYRRHGDRIYALCLRMTGDPAAAEDLTQDAFVRAWSKLGGFRFESAFGTWLHRLAVNVVLRALEKRREATLDAVPELGAAPRPSGLAIDLERAIGALPPRARLVFLLHDVEGYKHAEIAEATGIAVGTSKAQLHRARRLLMAHLDNRSIKARSRSGSADKASLPKGETMQEPADDL